MHIATGAPPAPALVDLLPALEARVRGLDRREPAEAMAALAALAGPEGFRELVSNLRQDRDFM